MSTTNDLSNNSVDLPSLGSLTLQATTNNNFNRETINSLGTSVKLTDKDDNNELDLYCYIKCGPDDSQQLKDCRGVVFNKDQIVMQAFSYTNEYTIDKINDIKNILECDIFDSHEGALIRIFYFKNKWYTTTHRKLDAFKSKWSSKESFGSAFKKAIEANNISFEHFYTGLDKKKQYMFLVRNSTSNRIVCDPPETPTVYHVGTFINGVLDLNDSCGVQKPVKHKFKSVIELEKYIDSSDFKKIQGVIIFSKDNKQYKIFSNKYNDLFKIRGNEPSVKFRYLQIRHDSAMVNMLYDLYPECIKQFEEYEYLIKDVATFIHTSYIDRFIKKQHVIVPKEEYNVIKECHGWYIADRDYNKINYNKVLQVLNMQTPTQINHMIRHLQFDNKQKMLPVNSPILISTKAQYITSSSDF